MIYGSVRELVAETDAVRPRRGQNQRLQPGNKDRKQDFFFSKPRTKMTRSLARRGTTISYFQWNKYYVLKIEDIWEGMSHGEIVVYVEYSLSENSHFILLLSILLLFDCTPCAFQWETRNGLECSHLTHYGMLSLEN